MQKRDSPEPVHISDPTPDASRVVRPRVLTPTERDTLVMSLHELAKNYLRDTTDATTIAHDLMHLYGMAKVHIKSTDKVFYADSGRQQHTVNALQMLDMWTVFRPMDAAGTAAGVGISFSLVSKAFVYDMLGSSFAQTLRHERSKC